MNKSPDMEGVPTRGYKASLQIQWVPLSEQHKKYSERIEGYVKQYVDGHKDVPRIAVVGAYRQGKTQLLFHILKLVLEKGGIAAYTHADLIVKLIESKVGKEAKIRPSDFPQLLRETISDDIKSIVHDRQPALIHPDVVGYLREHLAEDTVNKPLVLLIDELEQAYEQLQGKIETSDRNPIRSLLDASDIYTVLAFAPRSIYEYKLGAALGEGEAERGRFDIFNLPPVSPSEITKFLGIDRQLANFIWWISRGRAGQAIRAYNNSLNYALNEQASFLSFVESMGQISGVPCFNTDALMDRDGNFLYHWKEVLNLVPQSSVTEAESALLFKIDREFIAKATEFFGKLGFSGKHSMLLASYFTLLLEAISGEDEVAIIKKKDAVALIRATYELTLEHTFDEEFIGSLQKKLDELQTHPDLRYSLPDRMEDARVAERTKPSKFLPFDFDKVLEFFPFPMSSPQLPGASREDVDRWLKGLENLPLAEDEENSVNILFFKESEHFKRYCENERRAFVEKCLPEEKRTVVLLLQGDTTSKILPPLARWLMKHDRLYIGRLRPSLLGDFLVNALSLINPDPRQPRPSFRKQMEILEQNFENDRATLLKIHRYVAGLSDFVASSARSLKESTKKFAYEGKGAAFEQEIGRQKTSEGFFYPFTLAFYAEDSEGLRALAQIRGLSERSDRSLYGFLPETGGYRTAVRFLSIIDRKGVPQHSESVNVIQNAYKDLIGDLEDLAGLLPKDEFRILVEDDISSFILDSYYESRRFRGISQGEKKRITEYLDQSLKTQNRILDEEEILKKIIGVGRDASLKFSPDQQQAIKELLSLVEKMDSWRSAVYQRIFFVFAEQIAIAVKAKADEFWKTLNQLPPEEYKSLKKVKELLSFPDQFPEEVFRYLDIPRDRLANELKKMWEDAVKDVKNATIGGVHGSNLRALSEFFKDLITLQEYLTTIKDGLVTLKEKVQQYANIKGAQP